MPSFKHGKNTVFKFKDAVTGGTLRDVSNTLSDLNFPQPVDNADVTAFGANRKSYIVGLGDGTISGSGMFDVTTDGYFAGILGQEAVDFEYYPFGSGSGNPKYAGKALLANYEIQGSVGDKVAASFEFQCSGDVTRTIV